MNASCAPGRVAVIGDIAGHPRPLLRLLSSLGVEADPEVVGLSPGKKRGDAVAELDLIWPDDLQIVSAGDMVHRGPDSDGVIALIDRLVREGRWFPVVGNHEQLYVHRRVFGWEESVGPRSILRLHRWWNEGLMYGSLAIDTTTGRDRIVCHGGLTAGFWAEIGAPTTATEAAAAIRASGENLWRPGLMLGYNPSMSAGPVWAESGTEVALSWLADPDAAAAIDFDQFHGHSSIVRWPSQRPWNPHLIETLVQHGACIELDPSRSHVNITVNGTQIHGLDPGHGERAVTPWGAAVVDGTVIVP